MGSGRAVRAGGSGPGRWPGTGRRSRAACTASTRTAPWSGRSRTSPSPTDSRGMRPRGAVLRGHPHAVRLGLRLRPGHRHDLKPAHRRAHPRGAGGAGRRHGRRRRDALGGALGRGLCGTMESGDRRAVGHRRGPGDAGLVVRLRGADRDQLFITTAREGLSDDALAEQPLAGGLFRVEPDVRGGPVYVFDE